MHAHAQTHCETQLNNSLSLPSFLIILFLAIGRSIVVPPSLRGFLVAVAVVTTTIGGIYLFLVVAISLLVAVVIVVPAASLVAFKGGGSVSIAATTATSTTIAATSTTTTIAATSTTTTIAATVILLVDHPSPHFVRRLSALLGKDNLQFTSLDAEAVHFVARLACLFGIGILDKGKALGLLRMVVPGDVNVPDIPDAPKR